MKLFMIVVIAHFLEHLFQAYQLWVLRWERPQCLGLLGLYYPWLIHSEWLHYGHALFMLLGLGFFRPLMHSGKAYFWWNVAFILGFYHHIEHALLLGQVIFNHNLFDSPIPISLGQLLIPRLELHLIYNLMVLIPMLIALFYQFPPKFTRPQHQGQPLRHSRVW